VLAFDLCVGKLLGQVPRGAAEAAADVEDALGRRRATPRQHLIHEVELCRLRTNRLLGNTSLQNGGQSWRSTLHLVPSHEREEHLEILPLVASLALSIAVVAQMDVLAPVVLQDALLRPRIVLLADVALIFPAVV